MSTTQERQPDTTSVGVDIPLIDLVRPMPGFPGHRRFALVRVDDAGMLCELRSQSDEELSFLVVPAAAFRPDYAPVIEDDDVAELAIEAAEDVLVLLVLNAAKTLAESTVNLMAPVLVNLRNRCAMQVVLDDPALAVRAPLLP